MVSMADWRLFISGVLYTEISNYLQIVWSYHKEHGISLTGFFLFFPAISLDDSILLGKVHLI